MHQKRTMPHPHSSTSACNGRTLARKIKKQRVSWNDTFTKSDSHHRPTNQQSPYSVYPILLKNSSVNQMHWWRIKGVTSKRICYFEWAFPPSISDLLHGCPKAELLFKDLGWVETCGHYLTPNAYHYCPKVEVEAFAMWLW